MTARSANTDADFARLGISRDEIVAREDGMRTTGESGTYEWWYFDTHLDDGSTLVLVFYTKPFINGIKAGLTPMVSCELDRPDGTHVQFQDTFPASSFSAATDKADVTIASNTFRNTAWSEDGREPLQYQIHVEHDDLVFDVDLVGQVRPWRPGTGYMYFGSQDEHYFAWLPSVPQGRVVAKLTRGGSEETLQGVGYHDHNWGETPMPRLINHWYWGRAQAGDYSIVASYITAEHRFDSTDIPIFMVSRGDRLIVDDASKVSLSLVEVQTDERTGKPYADVVVYDYVDGDDRWLVRFAREATVVAFPFVDSLKGLRRVLARLARVDGAYLRFTGRVSLQHLVAGEVVEEAADPGIWELMWFGHVHPRELRGVAG